MAYLNKKDAGEVTNIKTAGGKNRTRISRRKPALQAGRLPLPNVGIKN